VFNLIYIIKLRDVKNINISSGRENKIIYNHINFIIISIYELNWDGIELALEYLCLQS
jgi:hypothetical protein